MRLHLKLLRPEIGPSVLTSCIKQTKRSLLIEMASLQLKFDWGAYAKEFTFS